MFVIIKLFLYINNLVYNKLVWIYYVCIIICMIIFFYNYYYVSINVSELLQYIYFSMKCYIVLPGFYLPQDMDEWVATIN